MKKKVTQRVVLATLGLLGVAFLLMFMFKPVLAVDPTGASVTEIRTETAPNDTAGNDAALAGNVTELTISAYTTTQSWQGYLVMCLVRCSWLMRMIMFYTTGLWQVQRVKSMLQLMLLFSGEIYSV